MAKILQCFLAGFICALDVMISGKVEWSVVTVTRAKPARQEARVIVMEIDPVNALQAAMEGSEVATVENPLGRADISITATGTSAATLHAGVRIYTLPHHPAGFVEYQVVH